MKFLYISKEVKRMLKPEFEKIYNESIRFKYQLISKGCLKDKAEEQHKLYLNELIVKIVNDVIDNIFNEKDPEIESTEEFKNTEEFKENFIKEAIIQMDLWTKEFDKKSPQNKSKKRFKFC